MLKTEQEAGQELFLPRNLEPGSRSFEKKAAAKVVHPSWPRPHNQPRTHVVRGYIEVQANTYQEACFKAMLTTPGFRIPAIDEKGD